MCDNNNIRELNNYDVTSITRVKDSDECYDIVLEPRPQSKVTVRIDRNSLAPLILSITDQNYDGRWILDMDDGTLKITLGDMRHYVARHIIYAEIGDEPGHFWGFPKD